VSETSAQRIPGVFVEEQSGEGKLTVSVGPQHPGSGHFRIIVTLDGDIVANAIPDPGFVHRGAEKMAEYRNYIQNIPHLERPVILDSSGILFPYVLAVEDLLGITDKVPERAKYLRIVMAEFNRIISHQYFLAIQAIFLGHSTQFIWSVGDREVFMDLAASLSGARVTFSYFVPGGVRTDTPPGFEEKTLKACDYMERRLKEYRAMMHENPFMKMRMENVGVIGPQDVVRYGCVGPTARASGVITDVRKDEPYSLYDTIDFHIPIYKEGDSMARVLVHLDEMQESCNIIRQVMKKLRPGPVKYVVKGQMRGRVGESYARTEAARGMMSYHIISDGLPEPYRVKIDTPSNRNLAVMPKLLKGLHLADLPIAFWSLDYWPVEADR
jgi:NADH-quinone oxidoreductase subunit D